MCRWVTNRPRAATEQQEARMERKAIDLQGVHSANFYFAKMLFCRILLLNLAKCRTLDPSPNSGAPFASSPLASRQTVP